MAGDQEIGLELNLTQGVGGNRHGPAMCSEVLNPGVIAAVNNVIKIQIAEYAQAEDCIGVSSSVGFAIFAPAPDNFIAADIGAGMDALYIDSLAAANRGALRGFGSVTPCP